MRSVEKNTNIDNLWMFKFQSYTAGLRMSRPQLGTLLLKHSHKMYSAATILNLISETADFVLSLKQPIWSDLWNSRFCLISETADFVQRKVKTAFNTVRR